MSTGRSASGQSEQSLSNKDAGCASEREEEKEAEVGALESTMFPLERKAQHGIWLTIDDDYLLSY